MIFVALELGNLYTSSAQPAKIGIRYIDADDMDDARSIINTNYSGQWALIPKNVFDEGIVYSKKKVRKEEKQKK